MEISIGQVRRLLTRYTSKANCLLRVKLACACRQSAEQHGYVYIAYHQSIWLPDGSSRRRQLLCLQQAHALSACFVCFAHNACKMHATSTQWQEFHKRVATQRLQMEATNAIEVLAVLQPLLAVRNLPQGSAQSRGCAKAHELARPSEAYQGRQPGKQGQSKRAGRKGQGKQTSLASHARSQCAKASKAGLKGHTQTAKGREARRKSDRKGRHSLDQPSDDEALEGRKSQQKHVEDGVDQCWCHIFKFTGKFICPSHSTVTLVVSSMELCSFLINTYLFISD